MATRKKGTVGLPDRPQRASERGGSRLGDGTRPVAIDRRLTTNRRTSRALMFFASAVAIALAASLFVAPLQRYFEQDRTLELRNEQLARLRSVNADLAADVERLDTAPGIEEAAREEAGLQNPGEERITIVATGKVPLELPAGWPYDLVTNIVATKRAGR